MSCTINSISSEDKVRCEFIVNAPREKVWHALTTREGWSGWFSEDVETDFQVGSKMRLDFGSYGECWGIVAEREEDRVFAYRWHPGEDCAIDKFPESEMTTVRFEIDDLGDKTRIVMTETGFENLPEGRRLNALKLNTKGWEDELTEMKDWLEGDKRQPVNANAIQRERIYRATPQKLWEAVATQDGLAGWFCKEVRGSFTPGEFAVLNFGSMEGTMKIVSYEPLREFSFRWHPGQKDGCKWDDFPESEATLVKLTIREVEGGAHLRMTEEGFANIPEGRRYSALELNRQGWTQVMTMIGDYLSEGLWRSGSKSIKP